MTGQGVIVSTEGIKARVEVYQNSECTGCASKSHCHGGEQPKRIITVVNDIGAKEGDPVIFESSSGKVVVSSLLIWVLPILAMFVGYAVANKYAGGGWAILSAFVFLILSFLLLKLIDMTIAGGVYFYPRISSIEPVHEPVSKDCHVLD